MKDSARVYRFLEAHKIFTEQLESDNCWQITLDCGTIIQQCSFKEQERICKQIWCPIHQKHEGMLGARQVKLTVERVKA